MEYFRLQVATVTFEWNPPLGSGPQVVVDHYTLAIYPKPLSQGIFISITGTTKWNATLEYNKEYTANITALNCAGESVYQNLVNIEYGKHPPWQRLLTSYV
jgi:hypothetical protein